MIFISHNSKDKPIVEPIAAKLAEVYGYETVFYDSWSIRPGDGIIDKMNEGLEKCEFFFFFVSHNSLTSEMVKMEWQNALLKKVKTGIRFIPIRVDNSVLPAIISQTLYLDLFTLGPDTVIRQIIDVIDGNAPKPVCKESNLVVYRELLDNGLRERYTCSAKFYFEPITFFIVTTLYREKDINNLSCPKEGMFTQGFNKNIPLPNINAIAFSIDRGITPRLPFVFEISVKEKKCPMIGMKVYHKISEDEFEPIELVNKNSL